MVSWFPAWPAAGQTVTQGFDIEGHRMTRRWTRIGWILVSTTLLMFTGCDEPDPCQGDADCGPCMQCTNGVCLTDENACDDGNVCTDDSCDPAAGCTHANNNDRCNGGNICCGGVCCGELEVCHEDNCCTPGCAGRECGDDGCGGSCPPGCGTGQICNPLSGQCEAGCVPGTSQCTDEHGFEACGPDPTDPSTDSFGPRIPCDAGDGCQDATGRCLCNDCIQVEIIFLLDRSSGMADSGTWDWAVGAFLSTVQSRENLNLFGFRHFPADDTCGVGNVLPMQYENAETIEAAITAPGSASATPIAAALDGLLPGYGDPNDGQAVVLLTGGDETCTTQEEAIEAAGTLWRNGVAVYPIGLSTEANQEFLDDLALAGGTGNSRSATSAAELEIALEEIFQDIGTCLCLPDASFCLDGNVHRCSTDGWSHQLHETCSEACLGGECITGEKLTGRLSAGWLHTCGIEADGTVACWGYDLHDETIPPAGSFSRLSAGGYHTCGIDTNGTVTCWGYDRYDQLNSPGGEFGRVSAGGFHTCGIKNDGTVACWGDDNKNQSSPPAGTFDQVSAGGHHTCGIKTDGTVACWGDDGYGQSSPPAGTFALVSAGEHHTCGVETDGTAVCWGWDADGQSSPPAGTFHQVSAGGEHTCGINTDGTVTCWGEDNEDQSSAPAGTFLHVSAGGDHTCGIRTDGTTACWGRNDYGQSSPPAGFP